MTTSSRSREPCLKSRQSWRTEGIIFHGRASVAHCKVCVSSAGFAVRRGSHPTRVHLATPTGDMPSRGKRPTPQDVIADLAKQADELSRTAKRNRKSLTGANFYAEKLVQLRT